jgi:hypothetical protein
MSLQSAGPHQNVDEKFSSESHPKSMMYDEMIFDEVLDPRQWHTWDVSRPAASP